MALFITHRALFPSTWYPQSINIGVILLPLCKCYLSLKYTLSFLMYPHFSPLSRSNWSHLVHKNFSDQSNLCDSEFLALPPHLPPPAKTLIFMTGTENVLLE